MMEIVDVEVAEGEGAENTDGVTVRITRMGRRKRTAKNENSAEKRPTTTISENASRSVDHFQIIADLCCRNLRGRHFLDMCIYIAAEIML